ncbi:MAG: single-stranded-DNA-specific exonuclease RecJ [Burkholderiales bacterium]
MPSIVTRECCPIATATLREAGIDPLLARIYAARGVREPAEVHYPLNALLPVDQLLNARAMALILADAIGASKRLLIVADYDADGATACAVGLRGLRALGAQADYLVPNRFEYGYGLTPEIVRLAAERNSPDIIITVDNGIASVDGVAEAARLGIEVLVTDHHLPGAELPAARCIVNPNQPDCTFPSKHLAGVGVMFYVLAALRAELRRRGAFASRPEPNLASLLDLVALGTVADVVVLDTNNRILVHHGLKRIREGRAHAGIRALYQVAGREFQRAGAYDLGFLLGPRLNAAGRLTDMRLGIECLLSDDDTQALQMARELDRLNTERRSIEADMHQSALDELIDGAVEDRFSLCLYQDDWHQGVVGILASRLKERFHRPAIAFARGADGTLKGSGRSIAGLHLRDALDLVSKRAPALILRFGGHAAAAGLTIAERDLASFSAAFEAVCHERLAASDLAQTIQTDGMLATGELALASALMLTQEVWGQGFAPPLFQGEFVVRSQRVAAQKHSRLVFEGPGRGIDAILFGFAEPLPQRLHAVYRLGIDELNGARRVQLTIEHWQPAD